MNKSLLPSCYCDSGHENELPSNFGKGTRIPKLLKFGSIKNTLRKSLVLLVAAFSFFSATGQGPAAAAPDPICAPGDVISMFSNVYTDVPVDTWLTPWSAAPVSLTDLQIAGNDTKLYQDVTFLGIETFGTPIDASGMTYLHMDVWSSNFNQFRVKLVDFTGPQSEHEVTFTAPAQNTWISYDIPLDDFTGLLNRTQISQLILSAMPNTTADFYIDNIYFSNSSCIVQAPDPTCDPANVISMFSNVYTDVPVDTWLTPWSAAPVALTDLQISGNDTKLYEDVTFLGIETFGTPIDATNMTTLHMDVWSSNFNQFRVKLVDFGATQTEHEVTFTAPAQNEWISYAIPLDDFVGLAARANLSQLILSAMPNTTADFYLDNVYFSTCTPPVAGVDVELCVDLSCLPSAPQVPSVFGEFNGGNAGANLLTDQGGGIWCATVNLAPGTHVYKFFDQIAGREDLAGLPCTTTVPFFGAEAFRFVDVVAGTPQTVTNGWESCDPTCIPPLPPPDLPITFDDPGIDYNLVNFGDPVAMNAVIGVDPLDPANMVVCATKPLNAPCWAGTVVGDNGLENPIPFGPGSMVMTVDVYSPEVGTEFLLKVEDANNNTIASEVLAFTTVANAWETLVFDFNNGAPAINLANTYSKVVVFAEFTCATDNATGTGLTHYFDNIMMCVPGMVALTCPPTGMAQGCTAADVTPFADFAAFEAAGGSAVDADPNSFMLVNTMESGTCPVTVVHTYQISDICGINTTNCDHMTLVEAPFGPIVTCPADQVVSCFEDIVVDPNNLTVVTSCGLSYVAYVKQPLITGGIPGCDGTVYTYIYKAVDECGNVGQCEQQFLIQNNAPTVTVPADATVTCFDEIEVSVSDVTVVADCDGPNVINVLPPVINGPENCPGTTYTYTYRVKDFCNRIVEVDRVFTIGNNSGPIITSIPLNTTSECEAGPSLQLFQAESGCGGEVQTSVSDPQVIGTPGCNGTQVRYTYTATDACGRTASHVQIITIQNDGPVVSCPETLQIFSCQDGATDDLIQAWLASITATGACGESLSVSNNYNGNPGMCINNGFTNVTFFATDQCGRTSTCVGTIIIIDTEAPIIYQNPQEVLVPCNGVTQDIFNNWLATQGGAEAIDGCWGNNISWSTNPANPQLNCAGGPQAIVVEFIARDGCGNTSSVTGTFNTKVQPTMVNISGQVNREDTEPIADVEMRISGGTSGIPDMDYTENGGAYGFPELEYEDNLVLSPEKNVDPLNGVSTYDLILMRKHILMMETLDSPYKIIAGDINRSGSITAFDMLLLRRLILFIDTDFTDNTSWRFVEADFVFPNMDNPFETVFPETYNLSGLEEEYADFIGVKIGDLDLSSIANEFIGDIDDRSNLEDLTFEVEDQELKSGEQYQIDFTAQNFEEINGFQFTLNFDRAAVEAISIEDADLSHFNENNYGMSKADNGAITVSWNHNAVQSLKANEVAFSLIITANSDVQLSEVLSISSEYTRAEAYQSNELMNVNLAFDNNGTIVQSEAFKLFQNQPNPFKEATMIGFNLPEAGAVSLKIYDVSGRLIHTQGGEYAKGYNQINLDRADLPSGVLYYHVITANDSDSKKMILLK